MPVDRQSNGRQQTAPSGEDGQAEQRPGRQTEGWPPERPAAKQLSRQAGSIQAGWQTGSDNRLQGGKQPDRPLVVKQRRGARPDAKTALSATTDRDGEGRRQRQTTGRGQRGRPRPGRQRPDRQRPDRQGPDRQRPDRQRPERPKQQRTELQYATACQPASRWP